jgi:hypothetical protein
VLSGLSSVPDGASLPAVTSLGGANIASVGRILYEPLREGSRWTVTPPRDLG